MYWRPVGQLIFANWLATTSAMSGKSPIQSSRRLDREVGISSGNQALTRCALPRIVQACLKHGLNRPTCGHFFRRVSRRASFKKLSPSITGNLAYSESIALPLRTPPGMAGPRRTERIARRLFHAGVAKGSDGGDWLCGE